MVLNVQRYGPGEFPGERNASITEILVWASYVRQLGRIQRVAGTIHCRWREDTSKCRRRRKTTAGNKFLSFDNTGRTEQL